MTTVLAALDANASAKPVLDTALAIATMFDATATALHVREDGAGAARELTGAAGIELRVRFRGSRVRIRLLPGVLEARADPPLRALNPAGEPIELTSAPQTFELFPRSQER